MYVHMYVYFSGNFKNLLIFLFVLSPFLLVSYCCNIILLN